MCRTECIECAYCRAEDDDMAAECLKDGRHIDMFGKPCDGFSKTYEFEKTAKYRLVTKIEEKYK